MKMEAIEGSETSAFKTQTPGKYPKENTLLALLCPPHLARTGQTSNLGPRHWEADG